MKFAYKKLLLEIFLKCDCLRDNDRRKRVINNLSQSISLTLTASQTPVDDVDSLLDNCIQRAKIEELIAVVETFEQNKARLFEIRRTWYRAALCDLVDELAVDDQQTAYRNSLPELADPEAADLWDMVKHLFGLDQGRPVLTFSERLAQGKPDLAADVRAWQNQVARFLQLSRKELATLRGRIDMAVEAQELERPLRLLIEITPDKNNRGLSERNRRYHLQVWSWLDERQVQPLEFDYRPGQAGQRLAEIEHTLRDLLKTLPTHYTPTQLAGLSLEFFLPRNLITQAIDQWAKEPPTDHLDVVDFLDFDLPGLTFGTEYRLVVRSWERLKKSDKHPMWQEKWNRLQDCMARCSHKSIISFCAASDEYQKSKLYHDHKDNDISCLGMTFAPPKVPQSREDQLMQLIFAGMPVIVWCRLETIAGETIEKKLKALLYHQDLADLPGRLKQERSQAASEDEAHIGNHLTLLWDDFHCQPPIGASL